MSQLPRNTRRPNGKPADPDAPTVIHEATEQFPPAWERAGTGTKHRHHGGLAETHKHGDDPTHGHDEQNRVVWPDKIPAEDGDPGGDGWFLSRVDQPPADPDPAVHPAAPGDASADAPPRDGDRAGPGRPPSRDGKGRFLARREHPVEVARFEQAVIEADHITYRFERNTVLLGTMLDASLEILNGEVAQLDAAVQAVHDSAPWYTPERVS